MPLGARLVFALAVAGLAVVVAYVATGQVGRAAASVGSVVGGFFGAVTTTHSPSPVPVVVSDAPTLTPPVQPETNEATVEVSGTIPAAIVGKTDFSINLYLTVKGQPPARVLQGVPVPLTPTFTISNVKLLKGTNNFTATLKGPGGESGPSKPIAYVLDQTPPAITVTSPAKDATVNGPVATITGKTQARSALLAHNADNLVNVAGSAAVDGSFTIKVPIAPGPNGITLKATDPAGNSTSVVVSVRRGNGKLTVSLTPSAYRVKVTTAHSGFTLTAVVTDPDGHPRENVSVTFTLSVPGVQPITGTADTDGTGSATFRTAIPKTQLPHNPYTAPATALATSDAFGSAQTQVPITYYR